MDFTKQFEGIATTSLSAVSLLRKAVVSVKKDETLFSPEQLTKAVTLLMGSLPYILFRPNLKQNTMCCSYSRRKAKVIPIVRCKKPHKI